MSETKLSPKAVELITAIVSNPNSTAPQIAKAMGVSVAQVTGGLASLKKAGLVEIKEGLLIATEEAEFEFGAPVTTTPDTTTPGTIGTFPGVSTVTSTLTTTVDETIEEDEESESAGTTVAESVAEPAKRSAMAAFVAAAEAPPVTATTKTKAAKVKPEAAPKAPTKADKARAVFAEFKDAPRKVLMEKLMAPEVGLSHHGANTYLYNLRKKADMVTPRGSVPETPVIVGEIAATTVSDEEVKTTVIDTTVVETSAETQDLITETV